MDRISRLGPALGLILCLPAQTPEAPLLGFDAPGAAAQRTLEKRLRAVPDTTRLRQYLEKMSAEPHHAGSPGSRAVAEFAAAKFREFGLDAKIETFESLLPYPKTRVLEMTAPTRYVAKLAEPALAEDPDSKDAGQLPPFNAFAGAGDVTAPVVYVNYGRPEDYAQLRGMGVDLKGKIALARYGKAWRGIKVKLAQEHGAVGCLIYSDPADDGYARGDVYPKGRYRPPAGVQRGSVMDMPLHTGDPLSPGFASVPGGKRLALAEARTLMKIPSLPISYEDATPLLQALTGAKVPSSWQGGLPFEYHVGPGGTVARLKVDYDMATRPVHNVIARLPGRSLPDEWIIYGNHHDAWVNGAADPLSGASAVLETARVFGEMAKQGWRPKRTLVFALWDAEEYGIIGSTEWVEKHATELRKKAVVYVNSDTTGAGVFDAGGSPSLATFTRELMRDFQDPRTEKPLLPKDFELGSLGAGSDFVPFAHHIGVPSLSYGFETDMSGVYHSTYDSFRWYTKFGDPDFTYLRLFTQMMATALARFSEAATLPFDPLATHARLAKWVAEIRALPGAAGALKLDELDAALADLKRATGTSYLAERALLTPEGLPRRPWYKNVVSAPGLTTGYGAKTLPGIREAAEAGDWKEANEQALVAARAIRAYAKALAGGAQRGQ